MKDLRHTTIVLVSIAACLVIIYHFWSFMWWMVVSK